MRYRRPRACSSRRKADSAEVFVCRTRCMRWLASAVDGVALLLAAIPPSLVHRRGGPFDMPHVAFGEALAVLPDMLDDALSDHASKIDGHRVADHAAQRLELDRLVFRDEGVVLRESLEQRALAQRESSRLRRVSEATVAEPIELRGQSRRGLVVLHSPVDGGVLLAGALRVTLGGEVLRPVAPRASRLRMLDALVVQVGEAGRSVQAVALVGAAVAKDRHLLDDVLHRSSLGGDRPTQLDVAVERREQHGTVAALREPVLGAVDDIDPDLVAETVQRALELLEHRVPRHGGDVLHRDDVGQQLPHQPAEVVEKAPTLIVLDLLLLLVAEGVRREGLARRAASENAHLRVAEPLGDRRRSELGNVGLVKRDSLVVGLVGMATRLLEVDARADLHTCADETMGEPARAAEEVHAHDIVFGPLGPSTRRRWCLPRHALGYLTRRLAVRQRPFPCGPTRRPRIA